MRRTITTLAAATLCLATSLITGCGLASDLLLGSDANQSESHLVEPGVDDCHEAVDQCESFVAAFCDRVAICGITTFDECVDALFNGHFPCETADGADDFSRCNDDMATASCDGINNNSVPQSCVDAQLHFSDDGSVCR